jgi:hypothetical protein
MPKPTPNLGVSKPKPNLTSLRATLKETATPATHDVPAVTQEPEAPEAQAPARRRRKRTADTQLVGAHLSPDVGKQLRMIAAEEDTDVKSLLIEAINLLFKTRGKPLIAGDPVER